MAQRFNEFCFSLHFQQGVSEPFFYDTYYFIYFTKTTNLMFREMILKTFMNTAHLMIWDDVLQKRYCNFYRFEKSAYNNNLLFISKILHNFCWVFCSQYWTTQNVHLAPVHLFVRVKREIVWSNMQGKLAIYFICKAY